MVSGFVIKFNMVVKCKVEGDDDGENVLIL